MPVAETTFCQLRRQVELQAPSEDVDDMGSRNINWSTVYTQEPARVENFLGDENAESGQVASRAFTDFTIRHKADVKASWRVVLDGAVYQIESLQPMPGDWPVWLRIRTVRRDD